MKLYEQLAESGFHTTIITTFGIDFPAYEDLALNRLRNAGCRNNIVIVDSRMLSHALAGASVPPQVAGRHYSVVGNTPKGVFHPKIILQLGRKKGRVFISSANMTCSGLAGNLEITSVLSCGIEQDGDQGLVTSVWHYIRQMLNTDDRSVRQQIDWMRPRTPWLTEVAVEGEPLTLSDKTKGMLVRTDSNTTISQRFIDLIGNEQVEHLVVLSPYWDDQLAALKNIIQALDPKKISLLVQCTQPLFPKLALANMPDVDIYDMDSFSKGVGRFVHAKLLIAQTENLDHSLFGSANCTVAALGIPNVLGVNEEASLYRCLPRGMLFESLGFSDFIASDNRVSIEALQDYKQTESIPLKELQKLEPGRFWCLYHELSWRPPSKFDPNEVTIELFDQQNVKLSGELRSIKSNNTSVILFDLVGFETRPSFAVIKSPEGKISHPGIIHVLDSLRNEAKEARTKKVDRLALELESAGGEGVWVLDVLDLLDDIQKIEQNQSPDSLNISAHNRSSQVEEIQEKTYTTLSYSDFVQGRKPRVEQDRMSRNSLSGSEVSLVRVFLNRLLDVGGIEEHYESDSEQVVTAIFDKTDELDELDELDGYNGSEPFYMSSLNLPKTEVLLAEQEQRALERFKQRKSSINHLDKAVVRFIAIVKKSKEEVGGLTTIDMLRLRALLTVIIVCGYADGDEKSSREPERLLQVDTKDDTWLRMIGRILLALFGGSNPGILNLQVDNIYDDIPDDLLECWAACYWVSACGLVLSSKEKPHLNFFRMITVKIQTYTSVGMSPASITGLHSIIQKMNERFCDKLGIKRADIDEVISSLV